MGRGLRRHFAGPAKCSAAGRSPSIGGNSRGETELTYSTDEWLDIWAFGTSPYGLGLTEGRLWTMTPREFIALKRVWGMREALFYNAHFRGADEPAYIAEDFIDPIGRLERKAAMLRDKADLARANARLAIMQPGDDTGVPQAFKDMVN